MRPSTDNADRSR